MGALFTDMPVVTMYMDDSIVFGYLDFNSHLSDVAEVLRRLKEAGMQVNPSKCLWFQTSVTYLGFQITREGIQPQSNKIQGILNMKQPTNQKEVIERVHLTMGDMLWTMTFSGTDWFTDMQ